jgi:hypothetical protein
VTDANRVTENGPAKLAQKQFRKRTGGHASSRLPRRSAFENVPRIVKIVFQRSRQIRVPRARRGQSALQVFSAFCVFYRERFFPILPVPVFDAQSDRRANRFPVTHACENLGLVLFDPLSCSASVTELPPVQFALNKFLIDR